MRKLRIVSDSSSDVITLRDIDYATTPMKVITDEREFVDNYDLNVSKMVEFFDNYKGVSKSSCPNTTEWLSAFEGADDIICLTITSSLSGSYNAAVSAKLIYEEEHEGARVFVIDSLSAGPELRLIIDKLCDYIHNGDDYTEICKKINAYQEKTGLFFMLKSVKNFANNGRISPVLAKVIGLAGVCIVGKASDIGTLEPMDKCRGESAALNKVVAHLIEAGLGCGKVYISHCENEIGALKLKAILEDMAPYAQVEIFKCRGLCSFYAEKGGMLIGFEKE